MERAFEVELSLDELDEVNQILGMCTPDERKAYSDAQLLSNGTTRCWIAANNFRGAALFGGSDRLEYDVAVPPSLLRTARSIAGHERQLVLSVDVRGDHRELTLRGAGGSTTVYEGVVSWPDLDRYFTDEIDWGAHATFRAHHLGALLFDRPRVFPNDDEGREVSVPDVGIAIADGHLRFWTYWAGLAPIIQEIPAEHVDGRLFVRVGRDLLQDVMACFHPESVVTVQLPTYSDGHILMTTDNMRVILMPRKLPAEVLREKIETVIEETCGRAALQRDDDGDYPLHNVDATVYGRFLHDGEPPALQVFAVVLDQIEASPGLLTEINELNGNLQFVRLFHTADQVLAEVDLLAATLDTEELQTAVDRIIDVDRRIKPMLAAMYGGEAGSDPVEVRWAAARSVISGARLLPVESVDLTGPDAIEDWPFPDTVWVISGWNPQGITSESDHNAWINQQIASDVISQGGRFVDGANRRDDGTPVEETLVVWGVDRQKARTMGSRANQDAIYEITADTVSLVSCRSDRVETWDRR